MHINGNWQVKAESINYNHIGVPPARHICWRAATDLTSDSIADTGQMRLCAAQEAQGTSNIIQGGKRMYDGNLGKCKSCGKRIRFIRMKSGKAMPVNDLMVNYRLEHKGKDKIVTPEGDVVSCVSGVSADEADGYGYISHFATCPNAQKHRQKA